MIAMVDWLDGYIIIGGLITLTTLIIVWLMAVRFVFPNDYLVITFSSLTIPPYLWALEKFEHSPINPRLSDKS